MQPQDPYLTFGLTSNSVCLAPELPLVRIISYTHSYNWGLEKYTCPRSPFWWIRFKPKFVLPPNPVIFISIITTPLEYEVAFLPVSRPVHANFSLKHYREYRNFNSQIEESTDRLILKVKICYTEILRELQTQIEIRYLNIFKNRH